MSIKTIKTIYSVAVVAINFLNAYTELYIVK